MVYTAQRERSEVRRETGYAVATSAGVELIREWHEFYLFSAADYIEAFNAAGFAVGFDPQGFDPSRRMYVLTRP
jgi:hypothetical protein